MYVSILYAVHRVPQGYDHRARGAAFRRPEQTLPGVSLGSNERTTVSLAWERLRSPTKGRPTPEAARVDYGVVGYVHARGTTKAGSSWWRRVNGRRSGVQVRASLVPRELQVDHPDALGIGRDARISIRLGIDRQGEGISTRQKK